MTANAQDVLHSFDFLPDSDKQEVVLDIIRRSAAWDLPPLSDEQLVAAADELLQNLDCSECNVARSQSQ